MTVRIRAHGAFFGRTGVVDRTSASGGVWVRIDGEWPAGESNELDGMMWFESYECEPVANSEFQPAAKAA